MKLSRAHEWLAELAKEKIELSLTGASYSLEPQRKALPLNQHIIQMKLRTKTCILVALALSTLAYNASAFSITFNGTAAEGSDTRFLSPFSQGGFTLSPLAGDMYFVDNNDQGNTFLGLASFDDDVLEFNDPSGNSFALTQNGGGSFDLISVRTGSLGREESDDGAFTFTGFFAGGGSISTTVLGLGASPGTSVFSGFTNLSSVTVTSEDGQFPVMDDLTVQPSGASVPDSGSTLALLSLAMSAIAGARRKFGV